MYKPATQLIMACNQSPDWKVRRAVYVLISHISEGCKKQVEGDLKTITNMMLNGLKDCR